MNITFGPGAFFAATMEELAEDCQGTYEELKALLNRLLGLGTPGYMELADLAVSGYCPSLEEIERSGWRGAASLARSRMAARAQAFARQMEHWKARQTMKRRKLMHAEGHFPDNITPEGKAT